MNLVWKIHDNQKIKNDNRVAIFLCFDFFSLNVNVTNNFAYCFEKDFRVYRLLHITYLK